jgi:hypothetical protein
MAALADLSSNQRNGQPKIPVAGGVNGGVGNGETTTDTGGVLDPLSSNSTPPLPSNSTTKKAPATTNGKTAKKLDPSEVRV